MEKLLLTLAQHLKDAGGLDLKECFVDGTFVPAKKGGDRWAKPSGARAPRSWALQTASDDERWDIFALMNKIMKPRYRIYRLKHWRTAESFRLMKFGRRNIKPTDKCGPTRKRRWKTCLGAVRQSACNQEKNYYKDHSCLALPA
jgi:hypothetical protein